jgi:hypothetical protein
MSTQDDADIRSVCLEIAAEKHSSAMSTQSNVEHNQLSPQHLICKCGNSDCDFTGRLHNPPAKIIPFRKRQSAPSHHRETR